MPERLRLVDVVHDRLEQFLDERATHLGTIAEDLERFTDASRDLLSGGKRFRALFCYWGWHAVAGTVRPDDLLAELDEHPDLSSVVDAAAGLELFHAAALVHDDIMDSSDTRRGMPSAHRRFEAEHARRHWVGSASGYGTSSALLLGDLLLGWSDELLDAGLARLDDQDAARAARAEFQTMRTEVTVGQYLDILEEVAWRDAEDADMLPRAHRVLVYKSAKYSIEAPLALGALMAGGTLEQVTALRAFGLPLGVAFQLRDDLLGVFGDPEVTGKPAGDDLREGKRTVLIALARDALPGSAVRLIDELLGDPELTEHQIRTLQATIRDSGAVETVESIIARSVTEALAALESATISRSAHAELIGLSDLVTRRSH
ncbi:polyprenyl synthetase family protein [Microcella indica]|uniref:polyprenyl synthetase family protein n=1 Tax=Microcella indica TaxID=2750620 RepID=UPI0015CF0F5E|nr:polyprenyl synthetase family protein [Microcella indica]MBU1251166.1 polyprenyl synthetase family protein [Actinomycetota bacterium]MBU1608906.1 polyprenyl synthetase family protein [Actinomycetota bacterium]MBU2314503.1 polyprenyl synthetase family protein [Actinomycetota bacterium]MBU2384302.1 polyprenyl synthetase family protein [Actinomycetota bacterium]